MDIHSTADDVLVVCHDATLDRTTNGTGTIREQLLSEIQALDAGYRWSSDDGATHPFRGKGFRIPTMEEVFQRFPHMRLNVEIKQSSPPLSAPLCLMLRDYGMEEKVLVASLDPFTMRDFRAACPEVATSATAPAIRMFLRMHKLCLGNLYRGAAEAFEVPPRSRKPRDRDAAIHSRIVRSEHSCLRLDGERSESNETLCRPRS